MKKINYNERANFYDSEVSKDNKIFNFLEQLSKKLNIKRVINCPCASGTYILDFSSIFEYNYFVDIDNEMLNKVKEKINKYNISNVKTLNINIKNLDSINKECDCIIMLNQGLQFINIEEFQRLLNKLNISYLILDLFDFKKDGKLTYFNSNKKDNHYLTRSFKIEDKNIKRYNKHKLIDNKIYFIYDYYINNIKEYTTTFELHNYELENISNTIKNSKYELYKIYGDYNFNKISNDDGHYILILRRSKNDI